MIKLDAKIKSFEVQGLGGLGDRKHFSIEFNGMIDKESAEEIIKMLRSNPNRQESVTVEGSHHVGVIDCHGFTIKVSV